jgi:hypothetical protein
MANFLLDFILVLLVILLVQSNGFIEFLQYIPIKGL